MSVKFNKLFLKNPTDFAKKHLIFCGVDPGYIYKVHDFYKSVSSDNRVCYWNITEEKETTGPPICYVKISKTPVEGFFCGFYLPWEKNHVIKCTLKDKRENILNTLAGEANGFFTYVIDGCSIFVEGPAEQPTVYHANNTSGSNEVSTLKEQRKFVAKDLEYKWRKSKFPKSSDIVLETSLKQFENLKGKALHAKEYLSNEGELETIYSDQYIKIFGMVFGVRQDLKWRFYLQKYMRNTSKKTGAVSMKLLNVWEFWPGGQLGVVVFRPTRMTQTGMDFFANPNRGQSIAYKSITNEML